MENYTKNLNKLNQNSLLEAGGKGANLGVLISIGLPVPPGFTVTAHAYRTHLNASQLQNRIAKKLEGLIEYDITSISQVSHEISSWIENAPMPFEIQNEIIKSYENLCRKISSDMNKSNLSIAVRSSATAEDLPSASFAGQQETFLGIYGKEALLENVKKCWASLWTSQAISYRMSMGFEHLKVDLAVVVQAMIASEAAGVMFTANPVTENRNELLVSASYGLGEAVVSGLVTPDTFTLTKKGLIKCKSLGTKELRIILTEKDTITEKVPLSKQKLYCLGDNELSQLSDLANLIENHYGRPQDIEWGLLKGKIYLLQARPITTMKPQIKDLNILSTDDKIIYQGKKPPFGFKDTMEHAPEPITPLDFAYYCQGDHAFQKFLSNIGFKISKEQTKPVERPNGCVAISLAQPKISFAMLWKMPAFLIRRASMDPKDLWQPVSDEMNAWLGKMEVADKKVHDEVRCVELLEQSLEEFGTLIYRRFSSVLMVGLVTNFKLGRFIKKAVGKEKANEVKTNLFRALPFRTALQNQALIKVAQAAATNGKNSEKFKTEFNMLMKEYGNRPSLGMLPMLSIPTWSEKPEIIFDLIDALLGDTELLNSKDSFNNREADYQTAKNKLRVK